MSACSFADIDECKMGGSICSQICINLPGNFTCACKHGYKLEPDGATCKATGKSIPIYLGRIIFLSNYYRDKNYVDKKDKLEKNTMKK